MTTNPTLTRRQLLSTGRQQLATIPTAALDAEILLCHTLTIRQEDLYIDPDQLVPTDLVEHFQEYIAKRLQNMPIAYITGSKEFFSLDLIVSPDTLIPRPETETLVELCLDTIHEPNAHIADLGTGSGAIAIALAHTKPNWQLHAVDISRPALTIAEQNAKNHQLTNIQFYEGDWLLAMPNHRFNAIVSNPPYLAHDDTHLQGSDISHEPRSALVADNNGLADFENIISTSRGHLAQNGWVFFEHGYEQESALQTLFKRYGYKQIQTKKDLAGLPRVTFACWLHD